MAQGKTEEGSQALWSPSPSDNYWQLCMCTWLFRRCKGWGTGKGIRALAKLFADPQTLRQSCAILSACTARQSCPAGGWWWGFACWIYLQIYCMKEIPPLVGLFPVRPRTAISEKSWLSSTSSAWGNNTSCVPQAGRSVCHGLWRPLSSHPQRCWPSRTYGIAIWPGDSAVFSTGCRWECQPLLSLVSPVSLLACQGHLKDFWKKHKMVEGWWCVHLHCRPTSPYMVNTLNVTKGKGHRKGTEKTEHTESGEKLDVFSALTEDVKNSHFDSKMDLS